MVEIEDALGLTDSIRKVMQQAAGQPLTAQAVRLHLEASGFNTRRYGNLLASIHTVLKRLLDKGQIVGAGTTADNKPTYTWRMTVGQRTVPPPPGLEGVTLPTQDDLAHEKEYKIPRLGIPNPTNTQKGKK